MSFTCAMCSKETYSVYRFENNHFCVHCWKENSEDINAIKKAASERYAETCVQAASNAELPESTSSQKELLWKKK